MIDLQLDLDRARKRPRARLAQLDHRLVATELELDQARPADFEQAASDRLSAPMPADLAQVGLAEVRIIAASISRC